MRPEPSRVLRSMGLSEDDAYSSFRVSVSEDTAFEQCRRAVEEIVAVVAKLGGLVTSEVDSSWKPRVRQKPEAALEVA
jgi:cysteine sulfinate desulfinase/cysteine desulfurase-like protein